MQDVVGTSRALESAGFSTEEEAVWVVATIYFLEFWLGYQTTARPLIYIYTHVICMVSAFMKFYETVHSK